MKRLLPLVLVAVVGSLSLVVAQRSAPGGQAEWLYYGGDQGGMKHSDLTDINPSNVQNLKLMWQWKHWETPMEQYKVIPGFFEATPLMIDGVLYVTTPFNSIAALDAETGKELWRFDGEAYKLGQLLSSSGWKLRGTAFWRDGNNLRILLNSRYRLFMLDAKTGKPVPTFGVNGAVSLTEGLARISEVKHYTQSSPPVVYKDLVIMGSQVPDRVQLPDPVGYIQAIILMGEEVGVYQGAYKVSRGLLDEFGPMRVVDTPITELGFAGVGVGAAMVGLRPIVEFMTWNFALLAIDQVVNTAAKMRYMSGGQIGVPAVFRGPGGSALQLAAQHSQAFESWYAHIPGLKVVMPATPADAKGLLKSAIRDEDPVVFIEGEMLYNTKGEVPEGDYLTPIGVADVKRAGTDVTLICHSKTVSVALKAAEQLAADGIEAEVVDLRTIRPLDHATVLASVSKTHRAVVVEEGWSFAGVGAQVVDVIQREIFDELDSPVLRVTGADVPMPYNKHLEKASKADPPKVIAAVKRVMYLES